MRRYPQLERMSRARRFRSQKLVTHSEGRGHYGHGKDPGFRHTVDGGGRDGPRRQPWQPREAAGPGIHRRPDQERGRPRGCGEDRLGSRPSLGPEGSSWLSAFHSTTIRMILKSKAHSLSLYERTLTRQLRQDIHQHIKS